MIAITAAIIVLVSFVLILAAFDAAALSWGTDSRDWKLDDYRR